MPENENLEPEVQTAEEQQSGNPLVELTKNYTEAEMNTLPKSLREEIEQARNGTVPAQTEEFGDTTADQPTAEAEPQPQPKSLDEINKSLVEELNKSNARYSTLNGKYVAEGERQRSRIAELERELARFKGNENADSGDEDNQQDFFTGNGNDNSDSDNTDLVQEGRELGIDEDVVKFISKVANNRKADRYGAELDSRISAIEARGLTEDLENKLHQTTGISINDFESQPLRSKYLTELVDQNGVSAMQAIIDAKQNRDNKTVADVVSQVVNAMKANGEWYESGTFRSVSAKTGNSTGRTADYSDMPLTPHSSGGSAAVPQSRGLDSIDAELTNALNRLQHGDAKMASKINQLKRERLKFL